MPDPRINFAQLQEVNSKRPQTSYGGISARQKSLQNSLRQRSSKYPEDQIEAYSKSIENLDKNNINLGINSNNGNNFDYGFKNRLTKLTRK